MLKKEYECNTHGYKVREGRHPHCILLSTEAKNRLTELAESLKTTKSATVERLVMGQSKEEWEAAVRGAAVKMLREMWRRVAE
jgi:hypothetical protein